MRKPSSLKVGLFPIPSSPPLLCNSVRNGNISTRSALSPSWDLPVLQPPWTEVFPVPATCRQPLKENRIFLRQQRVPDKRAALGHHSTAGSLAFKKHDLSICREPERGTIYGGIREYPVQDNQSTKRIQTNRESRLADTHPRE